VSKETLNHIPKLGTMFYKSMKKIYANSKEII